MIGIVTALAAAAASAAQPAPAAAAPALQGVWQGSIGTLPVRACFVQRDDAAFGAYYYLSQLRLIPLDRAGDGSGPFREGSGADAKSPRWTLDSPDSKALAGRWTGGGRTLPIRLARIAGLAADESPCASLLFNGPRLTGIRIVSQPASRDGVAYTKLILDHRGRFGDTHVETFALVGDTAAVRRIDARLREPLAGDPPGWFECVRGALETNSSEGEIDQAIEPRLITARWLIAMDHEEGDCGGAHPNSSDVPLTFDRTTGRQVDLHDWLNDKAVKRETYGPGTQEAKLLQPAFRDVLLAGWKPEDADCDDAVRQEDFWTVALTRTGLVFAPELPHVAQACAEDFAIPFARLRPYLSAEGLKQVAALQAEPARAR
jgi:hypothetical protein